MRGYETLERTLFRDIGSNLCRSACNGMTEIHTPHAETLLSKRKMMGNTFVVYVTLNMGLMTGFGLNVSNSPFGTILRV